MDNLTARLLGEDFEEAILDCICGGNSHALASAIRELHIRLATAKAELDRKDRTIIALEELRRQTEYVHSERIKEKEILAYDTGKELEATLAALATVKAEGAAEAYEAEAREWVEQAVRARSTYVDPGPGRMLERRAVEASDRAAAIRKGIDALRAERGGK